MSHCHQNICRYLRVGLLYLIVRSVVCQHNALSVGRNGECCTVLADVVEVCAVLVRHLMVDDVECLDDDIECILLSHRYFYDELSDLVLLLYVLIVDREIYLCTLAVPLRQSFASS